MVDSWAWVGGHRRVWVEARIPEREEVHTRASVVDRWAWAYSLLGVLVQVLVQAPLQAGTADLGNSYPATKMITRYGYPLV